ncbi:MAG TPA: hypothetical protein VGN73_04660 [Gemmatimonadaceae bacterium]|nr:hypothetical protein [Gemmatimonadaceae bacterium]
MNLLRVIPPLALAGLVVLQVSCGGDSSGPGPTAASIAAHSSTTITAAPGTDVGEPPSVVVSDASGNPMSGVSVTFAVTAGGGSLTGGHAVSDASGIATVGSWTLGQTPGTNTVTATTAGLPAVTFTAQGADPCSTSLTHTFGSTSSGQLSLSDCRLADGSFVDFYVVSLPTAGTYLFTQSGSFDTFLALLTSAVTVIGVNDDFGGPNTSTIKALLPAGNFLLGANSYDPNVTGSYTLASATTAAQVTNCEDVFVVPGITSDQSLQTTDCTSNGILADDYVIFLQAGQAITVTMSSTALDSYLEIFADGNPAVLVANDNIDGTTQNARFAFSSTTASFYIIRARGKVAGVTGAYTIAVQ